MNCLSLRRLGLVAALLLALPARAETIKVAVLPITGSDGSVEGGIERALRDGFELVRPSEWDATTKRLGVGSKKADDIGRVAREVGAQVVVTGAIKQDGGGWVLSISVRHGPTGKKAGRLFYLLASNEVDPETLKRLAAEIAAAVRKAVAGPTSDAGEGDERPTTPSTPEPAATPPTTTPPPEATTAPPAATATEHVAVPTTNV